MDKVALLLTNCTNITIGVQARQLTPAFVLVYQPQHVAETATFVDVAFLLQLLSSSPICSLDLGTLSNHCVKIMETYVAKAP